MFEAGKKQPTQQFLHLNVGIDYSFCDRPNKVQPASFALVINPRCPPRHR